MGGHGHGPHVARNESNMKESDEQMLGKIQSAELVKFNPNHFHMEFFDAANMYAILGGAPSLACAGVGALASYSYYMAGGARTNFYAHNMTGAGRLLLGCTLGLAFGYVKFGDRQRLHNAYLAERIRRRYPDSMDMHYTDLWSLKGVKAPFEMYRWQ